MNTYIGRIQFYNILSKLSFIFVKFGDFSVFILFHHIFSYENKIVDILETINNLIDAVKFHNNNDITFQCIEIILKFVNHVIGIKIENIIVLYPTIIVHILNWAQSSDLHQQIMSILQTIIINVRMYNNRLDQNLQHNIYEKLEESLNVSKIFV